MCSWLCLHSHLLAKLIVTLIMVRKPGNEVGPWKSNARKMTIYLIKNFTNFYFCGSQHFPDNLCFHNEWCLLKRCFGAFQGCEQQTFLGSRTYAGSNIPSNVNSQKSNIDNLLLLVIHIELVNLFLRTTVIPYAPLAKKRGANTVRSLDLRLKTYCGFFVIGWKGGFSYTNN